MLTKEQHLNVAFEFPAAKDWPPTDPAPDPHRLGWTIVEDV